MRALRLATLAPLWLLATCVPEPATPPPRDAEVERSPGWSPPPWLPAGGPVSPWSLEQLDGDPRFASGPPVNARAWFLADLERGEVLLAQDADTPYAVASLTKLVSALAWAVEEPDPDQVLCVGPEQYPTRPGARSRFETGACHAGWDWLGAALVASDNRGAMGLVALSGLTWDQFLENMRGVVDDVGGGPSEWSDPSGIEVGNRISARGMAKVAVAVAAHPVLSPVASAPTWSIQRDGGPQVLHTTNKLVERFETLAAKTGFTVPAGYCYAGVVRTETGGQYVVVVLGAPSSAARWQASERLLEWADTLP